MQSLPESDVTSLENHMLTCPECLERLQAELEFRDGLPEHHGGRHPASVQLVGVHHGARSRNLSYVGAARGRARQQAAVAVEADKRGQRWHLGRA